ncbi:hypothetical protein FNW52_04115 [Flavobacterium sp. ZT3R18]|uniref:hypothetical protein n=1 Tax=Flavobacterium sp. ZT3R18 TaxID=2594429 RepID=UPI001179B956|nr:hypothetical protein [Flavobacterium sp. ZT3R18]TRX38094.1 hypothetical protein FNW52_04115 [Flavobacterium sp. ZT3R18]
MKNITLIALLLCSFTILFAQAPQKMSYQSVIRKADGSLVSNTSVKIKVSILQGSATGTASYVETQTATTNPNGLVTLEIGGGTPVTGTFSSINWGSGTYFIKTETDITGGTNYTISGVSQLLSVPYALYAGSTQNKGKTSIVLTGNITNEQAAAQIAAELGPYTENVYIQNTTGLTAVDLSMCTNLVNLGIDYNTNLSSINLNGLTSMYKTASVSYNNTLTNLSFPKLTTTTNSDRISIRHNPAITSISFPALINSVTYLSIQYNDALTTVSLPVLTTANDLYLADNPQITTINFPSLTQITSTIQINFCAKLTSIGIPSLQSGNSFRIYNNALPSSQINMILNKMLTVTPTSGKYIGLTGQNPPAPPTGQGITDKATLISTGNSVTTD